MSTTIYTGTNTQGDTFTLTTPGQPNGIFSTSDYTLTVTDADGDNLASNVGVDTTGVISSSGLSLGSLLNFANYVVEPGTTATVNITASLLSAPTIYVGGNLTLSYGVGIANSVNVDVYGGNLTLGAGVIASALSGSNITLGGGGTFTASATLISLLSNTTLTFAAGGGTLVANGGGALINLSSLTINQYDPSKDAIEFSGITTSVKSYTIVPGALGGYTITLYSSTSQSTGTEIGTYTVSTLASGVTGFPSYVLLGNNTYSYTVGSTNSGPLTFVNQSGNTYVECFLPGSMIGTPEGDRAVENIQIGDVITAYVEGHKVGEAVVWAGFQTLTVRNGLPDDDAGYPVRVRKDAVAENVPYKDLLVTPEHCLFFDGKFVPVRMLVNGTSIAYDRAITTYNFYHIETTRHSVIMADGMLTESFFDSGNRASFHQHGPLVRISATFAPAKSWATDAAAPLTVQREIIEPIFMQILQRAEDMGHERVAAPLLTEESDFHLLTERGQIIRIARKTNDQALFMIPSNVEAVRLVSRTSRPADVIGPFVDDRRYLGVLVGDITLYDSNVTRKIDTHLTDDALSGWDVQEASPCRWTNGKALLPLGERQPDCLGILAIQLLAGGPYVVEQDMVLDIKTA